ncbi:mRNA-decapping enzyme 1B, partial [Kappamyces sp. JEL0680]
MELEKAKLQINLKVLAKYDKSISAILETTSHVVLYDFELASQTWKKRGIEGTLFLYERTVEPRFGVIVLNRLGLDNLEMKISSEMQIQLSGDYLMYKFAD